MRLDFPFTNWYGSPIFAPYYFPASATALYSLRKIVSAYAGKCLKVQRLSDSTTLDIGFLSNNQIDMASALTFGANTMLYVTKWYDQSGNGHDAIQATQNAMPELLNVNGAPWIAFNQTDAFCYLQTAAAIGLTGDQTIGMVCQLNTPVANALPIVSFDGTDGWFVGFNAASKGNAGYYSAGVGAINDSSTLIAGGVHRVAFTRTSGAVAIRVDGVQTTTGTGSNNASSTGMCIGSFAGNGDSFEGLLSEVFVYGSALSNGNLLAIDSSELGYYQPTGFQNYYNGSHAVQEYAGSTLSFGNVLQYEYTQAWTMFAVVRAYCHHGEQAEAGIFCNIDHSNTPGFPGYGVLIVEDSLSAHYNPGVLSLRVVNHLGNNVLIWVTGTTDLCDGKPHRIVVSYSGSGTAAGLKAYIDGVAETLNTQNDTLAANTIIAAGQNFFLGGQVNDPGNQIKGRLEFFQLDNVVRNQSYVQTNFTAVSPPPSTANTAMRVLFSEGSGTTVNDTSANAFTGTLSNANMWVP